MCDFNLLDELEVIEISEEKSQWSHKSKEQKQSQSRQNPDKKIAFPKESESKRAFDKNVIDSSQWFPETHKQNESGEEIKESDVEIPHSPELPADGGKTSSNQEEEKEMGCNPVKTTQQTCSQNANSVSNNKGDSSDDLKFYISARQKCTVIRRKSTFNRISATQFCVYFENHEDETQKRLMFTAQIQRKNGHIYIYDLSKGMVSSKMSKKHGNFVGKVKRTGNKSQFLITDHSTSMASLVTFDHRRLFQITDNFTPRKIWTIIGKTTKSKKDKEKPAIQKTVESVMESYKRLRKKGKSTAVSSLIEKDDTTRILKDCELLIHKPPTLQFGQYRLNFFGRVRQASIKNFQLIYGNSRDKRIVIQFGKVYDDCFNLDFCPDHISPTIAIGTALTQFIL